MFIPTVLLLLAGQQAVVELNGENDVCDHSKNSSGNLTHLAMSENCKNELVMNTM